MPERFKAMKMVAHHKYIVKDKLIDANRILEEVKKVIDSRKFPDIQTVVEEVVLIVISEESMSFPLDQRPRIN